MTTIDRVKSLSYDGGRARLPDRSGFAESPDGVRIAYDVYGAGEPAIVFLPSAPIIHARQWKGQVPWLSLRHRVIAYDGRGNGRSSSGSVATPSGRPSSSPREPLTACSASSRLPSAYRS